MGQQTFQDSARLCMARLGGQKEAQASKSEGENA